MGMSFHLEDDEDETKVLSKEEVKELRKLIEKENDNDPWGPMRHDD